MSGDILGCHSSGEGATGRGQDAAKCPRRHRTAPQQRGRWPQTPVVPSGRALPKESVPCPDGVLGLEKPFHDQRGDAELGVGGFSHDSVSLGSVGRSGDGR